MGTSLNWGFHAQAELHLHIEGTFEPELMLEIAKRNEKLGLLPFQDLAAAKGAYDFQNLQSFLDIYYAGCAVLLHEKVCKLYTLPSCAARQVGIIMQGIISLPWRQKLPGRSQAVDGSKTSAFDWPLFSAHLLKET